MKKEDIRPATTVTRILEEITEIICDSYCKYVEQIKDEDVLMETRCKHCPLNKI